MATIWLILLTVGAIALISAMYFGKVRNGNARRGELARSERGAKEVRDEIRRDPEYREE